MGHFDLKKLVVSLRSGIRKNPCWSCFFRFMSPSHVRTVVSEIVDKMMIAKDGSDLRDLELLQFENQGKSEDLLVVCHGKGSIGYTRATSAENHMCYPATSCTPNRTFARSKFITNVTLSNTISDPVYVAFVAGIQRFTTSCCSLFCGPKKRT